MSIYGVYTDRVAKDADLAKTLRNDDMERYTVLPETKMIYKWEDDLNWIIVDSTYPDQISKRHDLLRLKRSMVIDRLPDDDVRAAEYELRDIVVKEILETYPQYFRREGDLVLSPLTGLAVDVGPYGADPMVAVSLLASEDMLLLLPRAVDLNQPEKVVYPLKSGALLFPNGWSLRSHFKDVASKPRTKAFKAWEQARNTSLAAARLGKAPYQIHNGHVSHYMENFADRVDLFFAQMKPDMKVWRRNWGMGMNGQLFRHTDHDQAHSPVPTGENWEKFGYLRSEHETFRKLPHTGAIAFGIKTYIWKLDRMVKNEKAMKALLTGNDNLAPKMVEYREANLPTFREFLDRHRPKP